MLDLEPAFSAMCDDCGTRAVVAEEDYEQAHVELRVRGWTRDAAGIQRCPACSLVKRVE